MSSSWKLYLELKKQKQSLENQLSFERLNLAKENPQGFIKNPRIEMLPDGPDHLNWLELGEKEEKGIACTKVSWAPNFGWLWSTGWIDEMNIPKAKNGEKFQWVSSGIGGHGCP